MCIVIDININWPYLFWVAAEYVRAWRRASQHVHLVCTCAGMMEHTFTINSVSYSRLSLFILMDGIHYDQWANSLRNGKVQWQLKVLATLGLRAEASY